jgi:hypothetical protein
MVDENVPSGCEGCCFVKHAPSEERKLSPEEIEKQDQESAYRHLCLGAGLFAANPKIAYNASEYYASASKAYGISGSEVQKAFDEAEKAVGLEEPYRIFVAVDESVLGSKSNLREIADEMAQLFSYNRKPKELQ